MKYLKILIAIGLTIALASCSTTEKFTVYAPQETKIYTPNNPLTPGGITGQDGKINMEIPSDMYCGYILAQSSDNETKIPIGIDYVTKKHIGTKIALYSGSTIASIGGGVALGACIPTVVAAAKGEDDDVTSMFATVTAIGAGVAGIGAAIGMPAQARLQQTSYDYNFGYVKNQKISIPALSYTLLNPNPPKGKEEEHTEKKATARKKATSGKDVVHKTTSTKVSTARSDNARKIEGRYTGNGTLLQGKNIDEEYSEISVIIERVDKNHVSVRIIESGEDYFESPLIYEISKDKKGNSILKIENLPEASILISSKGKLTFNHKKVNIENTIYTLKIIAEKE